MFFPSPRWNDKPLNEKILGNRSMDFKIRMIFFRLSFTMEMSFWHIIIVSRKHFQYFSFLISTWDLEEAIKILLKTCFYGSTKKTKFGCWFCEQLIETELISETDLEMFMSPNVNAEKRECKRKILMLSLLSVEKKWLNCISGLQQTRNCISGKYKYSAATNPSI